MANPVTWDGVQVTWGGEDVTWGVDGLVLRFQAAFGVEPGTVPTSGQWVDLSDRLLAREGWDWTYGRQHELDRIEAGTGTVTLDNTDRALDETNPDSPYAGMLLPMVQVRLRAIHDQTLYNIFHAYVEGGWASVWQKEDAWVVLPLVDAFEVFAQAPAQGPYASKLSGARIADILDEAGWPAGRRDLADGTVDVQAAASDPDRIALTALRETAASEDGAFFVAPDGHATFQDRPFRQQATPQAVFGDGDGELSYTGLRLTPSHIDLVRNIVAASADGLATQTSTDDTSIRHYGRRRLAHATLLTSTADLASAARRLADRRAHPNMRVEQITVETHFGGGEATQALSRRVGDRIRVRARPPGGGPAIDAAVTIERVAHRAAGMTFHTTWQLGSTTVTLEQLDTLWAGQTLADFDTAWSGQTLADLDADPLSVGP